MIEVTCAQVAAITSGTLHGFSAGTEDRLIRSVVVDSRDASPGSLFVAIAGAKVDGHDYALAAVQAGAIVVLSARELPLPCIVVADPVQALGQLAHWVRRQRLSATVVAITGSSGKTSTKDMVAAVLRTAGPTVSAPGSFNTEVGVPLTILSAESSTQFLVLEMGMRGTGHIEYLCHIAEPDIAVIVNVGSAHVGMLGSIEAIAHAKGEIITALGERGIAVLNGDDARVLGQASRTSARVVTFGSGSACQVRATDLRTDSQARASFTLHTLEPAGAVPLTLRYPGEHFVSNALAAAAVGLSCGLSLDAVATALRAAEPDSPMRMQIHQERHGITVINDAYNANPESMSAALRTLALMAAGRRSWAVLGEMRELGAGSRQAHVDIGRLAAELGISRIVGVGAQADALLEGAHAVVGWAGRAQAVLDAAAATALLREGLLADDIVLIKASRSIGLDAVLVQVFAEPMHLDSDLPLT
ncbi:MAG: UDP-N-acetylmuramoyl-tripeptide--D-alanyl-D-alanine ligase [Actinomycetales bacterium]